MPLVLFSLSRLCDCVNELKLILLVGNFNGQRTDIFSTHAIIFLLKRNLKKLLKYEKIPMNWAVRFNVNVEWVLLLILNHRDSSIEESVIEKNFARPSHHKQWTWSYHLTLFSSTWKLHDLLNIAEEAPRHPKWNSLLTKPLTSH